MNSVRKAWLGMLVLLAPMALPAEEIGQIKTATGVVIVVREGVEMRSVEGARIHHADRILTRGDSTAGITFDDNSRLSLGPNSELDIAQFSFGDSNRADVFETTLHRGTLSAISGKITQKSPEAMRVRTPTTILGVRGTEFLVQVSDRAE